MRVRSRGSPIPSICHSSVDHGQALLYMHVRRGRDQYVCGMAAMMDSQDGLLDWTDDEFVLLDEEQAVQLMYEHDEVHKEVHKHALSNYESLASVWGFITLCDECAEHPYVLVRSRSLGPDLGACRSASGVIPVEGRQHEHSESIHHPTH